MITETPDLFAALKINTHIILGRVININNNELVFHSVSEEGEIPLGASFSLDVFARGQVHIKELHAKVISDERFVNELSFSKMVTRKIKVRFDGPEIGDHDGVQNGEILDPGGLANDDYKKYREIFSGHFPVTIEVSCVADDDWYRLS